jgi:hypothetical protein
MKPNEIFYRLLHSQAHFDDWNAARYNSYHYSVPGKWIDTYYKKGLRDPKDFPLCLYSGEHTAAARDNFLQIAGKYAPAALWSEADLKKVSELDGVCAFRDMASIHLYAQGTPYGGMEVVEFEGIFVSHIPESNAGLTGVLVKPLKTISKKPYRAHSNS